MNILPRLLFLFQSLPVLVSQSTFQLLEKTNIKMYLSKQETKNLIENIDVDKREWRSGFTQPKTLLLGGTALSSGGLGCQGCRDWMGFSIEQNSLPGMSLSTLPFLSQQSRKKS